MKLENRLSFLSLKRQGIGHTDETLAEHFDWKEIQAFAEKQGLSAILVNGIEKLPQEMLPPISIKLQLIGDGMMVEQSAKQQWDTSQKLVDYLKQKGIITVGLKGMTVAQWYPNPFQRDCCDFDCFLLKKGSDGTIAYAYEDGNRAVEAKGVNVDRSIYVHSVFDYKGLTVENHHYLAAIKFSKRHRKMDDEFRSLLLEERLIPVRRSNLMMGSPLFNAVFLMHHAHRHTINDYLPLKLLIDWTLFIENNSKLDWNRFWQYAEDFGMLRFAQAMTRGSIRLFGAKVPYELPTDFEADDLLEQCLWDTPEGTKGRSSRFERWLRIIFKLIHARKKYKFFYDSSSFQMIVAYIKGFLFEDVD